MWYIIAAEAVAIIGLAGGYLAIIHDLEQVERDLQEQLDAMHAEVARSAGVIEQMYRENGVY